MYRKQKYVRENGNLTNTKTIFRVKKYRYIFITIIGRKTEKTEKTERTENRNTLES
jgi:hypothetical protein